MARHSARHQNSEESEYGDKLERFGDEALIDRWLAVLTFCDKGMKDKGKSKLKMVIDGRATVPKS